MARHWTGEAVLELARGFQEACVLTAAGDLDVFSALRDEAKTSAQVARGLRTDPRGTTALLDALAAMELLAKEGDAYSLSPGVADALTEDAPRSVLPMVRHASSILRRWAQLAMVVKRGRPARRLPSVRGARADQAAFIGAMHTVSAPVADRLVAELGPPRFRHLLDVGGASGTWTIAFLRAAPSATATLFDLPEVIPMARRRLAEAGMADRVALVGGDFYAGPLPRGADLVWASAIIHQGSPKDNKALFRNIHRALLPGGKVLIRDIVMDPSRTRPAMGALFAINMLVATEGGGTYTLADLADALKAAGFVRPTLVRPGQQMDAVVAATKPRRK